MELDNQELEATRKREKSADEMFEELGYNIEDDGKVIRYQKRYTSIWDKPTILFDRISKLISLYDVNCLNILTLQAISKKVGELRLEVEKQCKFCEAKVFVQVERLSKPLFAEQEKLSVAMPYKIGCGIANGDFNTVLDIINKVFKNYEVTLYKLEN